MLFDTHAWIELFLDSDRGKRVSSLMNEEPPATSVVSLAELQSWALRNGLQPRKYLETVLERSFVLPLTNEISPLAGELHHLYRKQIADWGMVDSLIYATSLARGMRLVSGDRHFKGKPGVEFLD